MSAPDKIFVPTRFRLVDGLQVRESDTDEEYIRKYALLKKIDEVIAHLSDGSLTGYYESLAYKDIIELIESM